MIDFFKRTAEIFSFDFMVRAALVGGLVSLCAAILGVSLVLKRYSMIGDGLSHAGFGALAIAAALNLAPLAAAVPITLIAAFLLLRLGENSHIAGDAATALISTGALAVGVVIITFSGNGNADIQSYLFGSILAINQSDAAISVTLSILVLILFVVFYNKLFSITFDETFAKISGVPTNAYTMLTAALTAITIVLGMRLMGALLISSLLVFPPLSAMRLYKKFYSVTIASAAVSLACFFAGLLISYFFSSPAGATIVIVNMAAYFIFWLTARLRGMGPKAPGTRAL